MKKSNEFVLREILEQSLAGYWDWDIPTGDEYLSPAFKKMFGYKDHEIPNRAESWQKLMFAEDLPGVLDKFEAHAKSKGEAPFYNEIRYRHKNGSTVWVICTGKVIEWDDNGKPLRMVGCHVDITGRKRIEQNFRDLSMRQDATLAAVPDIIAEVDNDKVYTWMNETGLRFFGSDAIGKEAAFYFEGPQDTYSTVKPLFDGDPSVIYVESWQRRHDGAKRLLAWWCRVLTDPEGRVTGALSTARDITEIRAMQIALEEEKERLAVTMRSIGDAVIATDRNGQITLMNKVGEELTGWPFPEAHGKPLSTVFSIVNEKTRLPCENPVDKVLQSGSMVELANHTVLVRRDGSEIAIADSGSPIIANDGSTIGVVLVFRDITEKTRIERDLQNMQKLESLGLLAGGIAHDFNNLLGGIFGYIDMAAEATQDKEAAGWLKKARATIDRARGLTGQLLTFAKGGAPIKKIEQLSPFIEETARFALSGSNVSPRFALAPGLWPCEFDRNQIGQVIDNIVINAQQAMPEGGTLEIRAENLHRPANAQIKLREGDYVKITIRDHGIGMPREILPKIFDPFFSTKAKGHGLGLATCYSIIHRHGGCIDVESEPGKGSSFSFYLPAVPEGIAETAKSAGPVHKGQGVFLIMDDEEVVRDAFCILLKSMGYTPVCTSEGNEAIEFFRKQTAVGVKIAGMIADLTVPGGLGGREIIPEIRKIDKDLPVIVSSGYSDNPVMANPKEYGFSGSLGKPFTKAELSDLLDRCMTR